MYLITAETAVTDNLHALQLVEKPNPPAPFPTREGGAGNFLVGEQ